MPTRRDFAKSLMAASAALPVFAQTSKAPAAPPSALGKALTELTRAQYRKHLDDDELARIDQDFQNYATLVERLRGFELGNADEPDFSFASLVERW